MLTIEEKIKFFEDFLNIKNGSYADSIKADIYEYLFLIKGSFSDTNNFHFLNSINSKNEIEKKLDMIVSKVIMHEHHAGIEDIIEDIISI